MPQMSGWRKRRRDSERERERESEWRIVSEADFLPEVALKKWRRSSVTCILISILDCLSAV
jgi:hypothetical protein